MASSLADGPDRSHPAKAERPRVRSDTTQMTQIVDLGQLVLRCFSTPRQEHHVGRFGSIARRGAVITGGDCMINPLIDDGVGHRGGETHPAAQPIGLAELAQPAATEIR